MLSVASEDLVNEWLQAGEDMSCHVMYIATELSTSLHLPIITIIISAIIIIIVIITMNSHHYYHYHHHHHHHHHRT